jgi:hypothetical protein
MKKPLKVDVPIRITHWDYKKPTEDTLDLAVKIDGEDLWLVITKLLTAFGYLGHVKTNSHNVTEARASLLHALKSLLGDEEYQKALDFLKVRSMNGIRTPPIFFLSGQPRGKLF